MLESQLHSPLLLACPGVVDGGPDDVDGGPLLASLFALHAVLPCWPVVAVVADGVLPLAFVLSHAGLLGWLLLVVVGVLTLPQSVKV